MSYITGGKTLLTLIAIKPKLRKHVQLPQQSIFTTHICS